MMQAGCLAVALWAAAGSGPGAGAAPAQPLLVVVEGTRAGGPSAASIRRSIADELKRPVVGPQDATASGVVEILLVTVGPESVTMNLRRAGTSVLRRQVAAVPGGAAGLQVVAWLAGNVVRDQTADVLVDGAPRPAPATRSGGASTEAAEPAPPAVAAEPSPLATKATPPTQPPPQQTSPARSTVVAADHTLSAPAIQEDVDDRLSFGLELGYGFAPAANSIAAAVFPLTRIELLARMRERWRSWFSLGVQGGSFAAAGLSGGVVRRVHLVPGVWAAEFGGGAGFLVGDRPYVVLSPGGAVTDHRIGILPVIGGRATSSLFTWGGEMTATLAVHQDLSDWSARDVTFTLGGRVGF